jgi:hypothetical protein
VELDSKPGLGVGHHWDWEAADGTEGPTTEGGGLSGRGGTGCSDGDSMLGMYNGGTGGSSSGSPCRTGLFSFWSLGFIACAMKTLLCPFLLAQNWTQGGMA